MEHTATDTLGLLPADQKQIVAAALTNTFGSTPTSSLNPVGGGASGALIYRFDVTGKTYLLRVETRRDGLRNPHQHVCMQAAVDAGIAPPLHYVHAATG